MNFPKDLTTTRAQEKQNCHLDRSPSSGFQPRYANFIKQIISNYLKT